MMLRIGFNCGSIAYVSYRYKSTVMKHPRYRYFYTGEQECLRHNSCAWPTGLPRYIVDLEVDLRVGVELAS